MTIADLGGIAVAILFIGVGFLYRRHHESLGRRHQELGAGTGRIGPRGIKRLGGVMIVLGSVVLLAIVLTG